MLWKKKLDSAIKKPSCEGFFSFVGVARFELATPCSQSRCANRTALHPEKASAKVILFFIVANNFFFFSQRLYSGGFCKEIKVTFAKKFGL